MPVSVFLLLFFVIFLLSLYDLKYRTVPNWVSLPLMLVGFIIAGFPGNPVLWIGSVFIFQAWRLGVIGGGDAKLWIGLLWCLFSFAGEGILVVMSVSLVITGLAQLAVRAFTRNKVVDRHQNSWQRGAPSFSWVVWPISIRQVGCN